MDRRPNIIPNLREQMAMFNGQHVDPNASFANVSNPLNVTCPARIVNTSNTQNETIYFEECDENLVFQHNAENKIGGVIVNNQHAQQTILDPIIRENPKSFPPIARQVLRENSYQQTNIRPQIGESLQKYEHIEQPIKNRYPYRTQPKNYGNSTLNYGKQKRLPTSQRFCKNYDNGKCNYGNRCRFIHRQVADHQLMTIQNLPQMYPNIPPQGVANQSMCHQQQYSIVDMNQTMPVFTSMPINNQFVPNVQMDTRFPPPSLMQVQSYAQPFVQIPNGQENVSYYPFSNKYNPYF